MCQRIVGMHLHGNIARQPQVENATTQQGCPQIRVVVTGRQVVCTRQDDRSQDDDLTQKDVFFLGDTRYRRDANERWRRRRSVRSDCLLRPPPLPL